MRYQLVERDLLGVEHHWRRIVNDAMSNISFTYTHRGGHTKRSNDSIISDHQLDTRFWEGGDTLKSRLLLAMSADADPSSSPATVRIDPFASCSIAASYPLAVS